MDRINCILEDDDFKSYLKTNEALEVERIFCHHDITHFKEVIYAAGLLHDIGRWVEYKEGLDHAIASAQLAEPILRRCGFEETEIDEILSAIKSHRQKDQNTNLGTILYEADKNSRPCYNCKAIGQCKRFTNGEKFYLKY